METTITREQMVDKLCQLSAEQAAVNLAEVNGDTHLFQDLNFDSLDAVDYTMAIEDEFDVSITDQQAEQVKSIRQASDLLSKILDYNHTDTQ